VLCSLGMNPPLRLPLAVSVCAATPAAVCPHGSQWETMKAPLLVVKGGQVFKRP
jgi:hypothetical protein